ncbi:MAG: hypothetical protein QF847_03790 [Candidatus Marinimicrobia bacterium]|jgi:hypothetical protein|nr:hypothetical protein [Candidatus Neomarinimicrobiota bacterium]MBT88835.1 hypothetical protein [Candidatus Neomarinimicrobiota bacterium]MDP6499355.1 hypothetical protein [Candidatus Neomarinimicrobiota bacterium]MDP6726351.1 hypothetical protein [Candidatus Neomarinimicrobiota bacterium]MDP7216873.1 hypothetical protein [Candidatus Neomarinimicrobiota bacterium]|tara:strand:- start:4682 stop:5068 length:387 start_codon:yes stop_codon:yes gene_type:complete
MEKHPEEFKLTKEDIQKTEQKIAEFDLSREQYVLSVIPQKLESLIQTNLNDFIVELINDVSRLYNIIMSLQDLDDDLKRRILYALDYFVDKDDEIPDEIPDLGYLDDLVIVRYIVDQIMKDNSELFQA